MLEGNVPSRAVTIGGGVLAVAGLAAALAMDERNFAWQDWTMAGVAAIAVAFVATWALPIRGLRMRRNNLNAQVVFLDVPIAVPLFALGAIGPTASALAFFIGYIIATILKRRAPITDLMRHGILRVLAVLVFVPFGDALGVVRQLPLVPGLLAFTVGLTVVSVIFNFGIVPLTSSLAYRIALMRVLERTVRDPRTWITGFGNIGWAAVVREPILFQRYWFAMVLWLPVILTARLLKTIDEQHAELHRLRLVRDAVQAMLGDRDPLPQINAILATLRVPAFDETVSVLAATGARTDTWRTVTTLGPELSSAGDELRRRILARLKFSGQPFTTLRDEFYVTYAFGARLADGELHGAMIVHRRKDRPLSAEQVSQFTNAAFELAPLLRDMRTIAATQNAATIDGLTGLYNRATALERLQNMLDEVSIAQQGAVLLLDIDHFKTINDHLGHAAGDDCLRKIGEIIRNGVRGGDTAGRIGGEEFLIVMPGATRDIALGVAERLRLAVALGGMKYANGEPVTTSIGAAAANVGDTMETILARADRGLYEAKRMGRNRIVENLETA